MNEFECPSDEIDVGFLLTFPISVLDDLLMSMCGRSGLQTVLDILVSVAFLQISESDNSEDRTHGFEMLGLVRRIRSLP